MKIKSSHKELSANVNIRSVLGSWASPIITDGNNPDHYKVSDLIQNYSTIYVKNSAFIVIHSILTIDNGRWAVFNICEGLLRGVEGEDCIAVIKGFNC